MRNFILFYFIFFSISATATNYYVSNSGNDSNDGLTEATAWQTLDKVNAKMRTFNSGDIIFFNGGDEFFGTLKIETKSGLTFTSYGVGMAILRGSKSFTGWVNEGGNIWSVTTGSDNIYNVFENNTALNIGRFPNLVSGNDNPDNYLVVTSVQDSKNEFTCNELIGKSDLVGATVFIRTASFQLESSVIKTITSGGKITLSNSNFNWNISTGSKFFITNHRSLLNSQGEWYYDSSIRKLYMYSSFSPINITATVIDDNGIYTHYSHNTEITNISFRDFNMDAIRLHLSNNCKLTKNNINYCNKSGIYIKSSDGTNVINNNIINSTDYGIATETASSSLIESNSIENIFLLQNFKMNSRVAGAGILISSTGTSNKVKKNKIKNIGYNGINIAKSSNTIVEENYIENFCLVLEDGSGIYLYSSPSNAGNALIKKNIIIGYSNFFNKRHDLNGIYLDDHAHSATISSNSISHVNNGIFLHNAYNNNILYNNIYQTISDAILLKADNLGTESEMVNNKINNNEIFLTRSNLPTTDDPYPIATPVAFGIKSKWDRYNFGTYNYNKFFTVGTLTPIGVTSSTVKALGYPNTHKRMLLNEWTELSGQDANSFVSLTQFDNFNVNSFSGSNLFTNSDFSETLAGWQRWNTTLTIKSEYLHVVPTASIGSFITPSIKLDGNKDYLFEFDANAENTSTYVIKIVQKTDWGNEYEIYLVDIIPGWHTYKLPYTKNTNGEINIKYSLYQNQGYLDIDNIKFTATTFDALEEQSYFAYNKDDTPQPISLPSGVWEDLDGKVYSGSISLEPFASKILIISDKSVGSIDVNAGDDQTICWGESVTLTASGGLTYSWSNGETTPSITVNPTTTTTYTVTVSDGSNSDTDNVLVTVNELPIANAGLDKTIDSGQNTTLTASGGSSYQWSNGASTASITVNPNSTTTYTVTVTNSNGCEDTDSVNITVNAAATLTANAGDDVSICNGESTTLTASGGSSYSWNTGATTASITVDPNVTTTYTVTVTEGSASDSDSVTVAVSSVTANAGSDQTIENGQSITLTASGGDTYKWNTGATTQNITVNPSKTTTYLVTVSNANGCEDTDSVNVTVNAATTVTANAGDVVSICNGESTTLTASGGSTYSWSTGATTQSITVNPNTTTTYTVTVSEGGASDSDSVTVAVSSVTANAGVDQTIENGQSVTLTASGGDSYQWNIGATTQSITVSPQKNTIYSVTVSNTSGCEDTDDVQVSVNQDVVTNPPPANAYAGEDVSICSGESVTLAASGGATYLWDTGATTQVINVNPIRTTTYTLSATRGGVTNTDQVIVTVDNCTNATIDEDIIENKLMIYPNPTKGKLNVKLSNTNETVQLEVVNINGSIIHSETVESINNKIHKQIDLSRLSNGVYYVNMRNSTYNETKKILVY